MKPGDVIIRSKVIVPIDGDRVNFSISDERDRFTLVEGKADIKGCILARNHRGEIHCINPRLFTVLYTLEELVAKKMMEPEPARFILVGDEVEQDIHHAVAQSIAAEIDKSIMESFLPTASSKGAKAFGKMFGFSTGNEE